MNLKVFFLIFFFIIFRNYEIKIENTLNCTFCSISDVINWSENNNISNISIKFLNNPHIYDFYLLSKIKDKTIEIIGNSEITLKITEDSFFENSILILKSINISCSYQKKLHFSNSSFLIQANKIYKIIKN